MLIKQFTSFLILTLAVSSCAVGPVNGVLFTRTKFAGQINSAADVPVQKKASGCMHQVLGTVAWGDATAGTVAIENDIHRIAIIDHSTMSILSGVYSNYCTIVAGD
ncbi:MAG TPA: TRL domain-containing protein [Leptospiraceae bacterium]|nr:TRL-like family protein [Leptospirales bacterium]HMU83612.1 TRL domain-containing protein [Leptospiraceae bacterium]HMW59862.1 TRL domain-containing protein [Leptospiraceae bacterium]HMX55791.1 TRL domain-containing protein [Leptospiraceae bacterium]HMZ35755.1 TRL domain-containing protein [Leptospiraceae bacterium]